MVEDVCVHDRLELEEVADRNDTDPTKGGVRPDWTAESKHDLIESRADLGHHVVRHHADLVDDEVVHVLKQSHLLLLEVARERRNDRSATFLVNGDTEGTVKCSTLHMEGSDTCWGTHHATAVARDQHDVIAERT